MVPPCSSPLFFFFSTYGNILNRCVCPLAVLKKEAFLDTSLSSICHRTIAASFGVAVIAVLFFPCTWARLKQILILESSIWSTFCEGRREFDLKQLKRQVTDHLWR